MPIKNVVFDIGNVLVTWNPLKIVTDFFQEYPDKVTLTKDLFKSETWLDLNKGLITEREAISIYRKQIPSLSSYPLDDLMDHVRESLVPIDGSFELLDRVYNSGIPIYCITDNVKEIMIYLKGKYDFFDKFTGIIVSADVGCLKPTPEIYKHLLHDYQLIPSETLFIDDHLPNVEGARNTGMHALQFIDAVDCEKALKNEWQVKFI